MNGILLLVGIASGFLGDGRRAPIVVPAPEISSIGTCEASGRSFDMRRLMLLENRSIDIDNDKGLFRITLDAESVNIKSLPDMPNGEFKIISIADEIDEEHDLDITIKLAIFEGSTVIFWKETFLHRGYRQGMFSISGDDITYMCDGVGGRYQSH